MPRHPFHKVIGDIFVPENFPVEGIDILKDTACGGEHTLPLFCSDLRSYATRYACVDLMIIKDRKIKVIMEIEESNVKPLHLFGKYLAQLWRNIIFMRKMNTEWMILWCLFKYWILQSKRANQ